MSHSLLSDLTSASSFFATMPEPDDKTRLISLEDAAAISPLASLSRAKQTGGAFRRGFLTRKRTTTTILGELIAGN